MTPSSSTEPSWRSSAATSIFVRLFETYLPVAVTPPFHRHFPVIALALFALGFGPRVAAPSFAHVPRHARGHGLFRRVVRSVHGFGAFARAAMSAELRGWCVWLDRVPACVLASGTGVLHCGARVLRRLAGYFRSPRSCRVPPVGRSTVCVPLLTRLWGRAEVLEDIMSINVTVSMQEEKVLIRSHNPLKEIGL